VVERFHPPCFVLPHCRPLCFVRPLAPQNRRQGGDSAHFENHCSTSTLSSAVTRNSYVLTAHRPTAHVVRSIKCDLHWNFRHQAAGRNPSATVVTPKWVADELLGGWRTAVSILCRRLEFLEVWISTFCVTSAKPRNWQISVNFTSCSL